MNSQVKEKWIAALRSGEYQQGAYRLRSNRGFCCLGVLTDLYAKEHNENWSVGCASSGDHCWYFQEETQFLPLKVMNWAGIEDAHPEVKIVDEFGNVIQCDVLSYMNDMGKSFSIIADVIEKGL